MKKTLFIPLLLAALLAALAVFALWPAAKQPVPNTQYILLDGSTLDSQSFKGKVTLVNFWATSCATCITEMPEIVSTYETFKTHGFNVLAIAMDYDPPAYVVRFTKERKLPFQVAIDNTGHNARAWGNVNITPSTFIVNKEGKIVKSFVGTPDFTELHHLIKTLLAA